MLLTTSQDLTNARKLIKAYRNYELATPTPQFWLAKRQLDSAVHPDTGNTILFPFRMSCCVLSNLIITAGMLTPGLGTKGTIFWQWANQSLNVAINAANANKSQRMSPGQMLVNYIAAVSTSCGVALGLNSLVSRLRRVSVNTKLVLGRLVPFVAVVTAGVVNVGLMRSNEILEGITVRDRDGGIVGSSKRAAMIAVGETAVSRVINATPIMVVPPMILLWLQRNVLRNKSAMVTNLVNIGLVAVTSFGILPFALAVYPQTESVHIDSLEPELRGKVNKNGDKIDTVFFNRGM